MTFREPSWSAPEKKIARRAFDTALEVALTKTMAEFKHKANAVTQPLRYVGVARQIGPYSTGPCLCRESFCEWMAREGGLHRLRSLKISGLQSCYGAVDGGMGWIISVLFF